ncbi:MAG: ABC transporter permease subunit [Candidatus Poribacteria bacterium]|nr:ABC transporter permease subunit [Candidatus Poribacteria bacterium]
MIWHILRRELLDHLTSLRFALTIVILVALMITNAIVHLQIYPKKVRRYSERVTASQNALASRTQLYELLQKGPGPLYKRPSSLAFVADGGDAFLPAKVESNVSWKKTGIGGKLESIWSMSFPVLNMGTINNLRPSTVVIDWVFVITYLLSFIPLVFTFDAIAGEREQGTLRLCLANPISRPALLTGKFLGAFITVLIPFYLAVLCNLAIISTNNWTQLGAEDWGRLGIIILIASGYAGIFVAVGILVSATTQESRLSLVLLLLIWMTVVVFMPSTLGTLAAKWLPLLQTPQQFEIRKADALDQLERDFERQMNPTSGNIINKLLTLRRMPAEEAEKLAIQEIERRGDSHLEVMQKYVNKDVEIRERLNREQLAAQWTQVLRARQITRCSPAAIVQYALESMARTGLNRHLQFFDGVDLYLRQFRNFIVEMDRSDPESLHLIGIPQGMSKKPVSPEAVPKFEDRIRFQDTINFAIGDILLLLLLLGIGLLGAFLVFLRTEI